MFHPNRSTSAIGRATLAAPPEKRKNRLQRCVSVSLCVLSVIWMFGCTANPSPEATTPRTGESTYPSLLIDDEGERQEAALAAWASFTRDQGIANAPAPELQPVTATIRSIPVFPHSFLSLPGIGNSAPMSEEETREALRRFIKYAGPLLCGDPQQLSLVQRVDGADGVKEARYQQRPFRYALRGGYGELRIGFTSDRRVTSLSSTCIPEVERIRRGFVGLGQQRIKADKAVAGLNGRVVTYAGAGGLQQTYTISEKDNVSARDLVIYPIERAGEPPVLEFHVAWEIIVEGVPGVTIYMDSIMGDILGVEQEKST